MNEVLADVLTQTGIAVGTELQVDPCSGGDINQAFHCRTAAGEFFVKLNRTTDERFFSIEARALTELTGKGQLSAPSVIGTTQSGPYQALVLSWERLHSLTGDGFFRAGEQLARCHQATHAQHGWYEDNLIGTTVQKNGWQADWVTFFTEQRLGVLIDRLNHSALNSLRPKLVCFADCCDRYQPQPSLLHGDLWCGNLAADEQGDPVFFDPASYYGDRETDLALTELFGGFPQSFYRGYESVWPLDPGYGQRKPWYQLYHILNHAIIFGGHYLHDAVARLRRLTDVG